jgi:hypothetical protein
MTTLELCITRWVEIPLATGSGTPDDVEAVVVNPAGTQTVEVCTLEDGHYGVLVTFYLSGKWTVRHNAFVDADAVNPYDSRELEYHVQTSRSSNPFQRA